MQRRPDRVTVILLIVSALGIGLVIAWPGLASVWRCVGALLALAPLAWRILFSGQSRLDDSELQAWRGKLQQQQHDLLQRQDELDQLRQTLQMEFERRENDLVQREQHLATRFARFHEFLEYPDTDSGTAENADQLRRLGEQDREVRKLLEAEAERVYEKIRGNGYMVDGKLDLILIRDEALSLIQRVAGIYRPDSAAPLMEASLEQLARAASRIWLHLLVLLEQLPLGVQQYSIGTLYGYIRKAVIGYGVYQKASPWLTYATRGLYAGRLVAASNPAALGAWWLATEIGRQGAKKLMEKTLDRQAVGLLQQVITVIGVEAAGIYGTGFRQRDPAWILGAELVELIAAFPPSGLSLRHGLQKVTSLPLLSEYDRIYLYRCLASHRTAGLVLADSAMLTREQREHIVRELEQFFAEYIHGATDAAVRTWRSGVESRFDLRLKLCAVQPQLTSSRADLLQETAASLRRFVERVVCPEPGQVIGILMGLRIIGQMTERQRMEFQAGLALEDGGHFEPPMLDPTSDLVELYLRDLATCAIDGQEPMDETEQFVVEAGAWFRRSESDIRRWLDEEWRGRLKRASGDESLSRDCEVGVARLFFVHRRGQEKPVFRYGELLQVVRGVTESLPGAWLLGYEESGRVRLVIAAPDREEPYWVAESPLRMERISGVFLDDLRLCGGAWAAAIPEKNEESYVQIRGNLRGGRFSSYFSSLLRWGQV
ncbi:MAG: hypothetical protein RLZZ232_299 [Planctomycetota bacterium]